MMSIKYSWYLANHVVLTSRIIGTALASAIAIICATAAVASPVTYLFTGTGSGNLGGTLFTDQPFSLTFVGDTGTVTADPYTTGFFEQSTFSSTSFVIGTTTSTLVGGARLFVNQPNNAIGIGMLGWQDILNFISPRFSSYDLKTTLEPLTPTASYATNTRNNAVFLYTSAGTLKFSNIGIDSGGFQSGAMVVPEGSSMMFWGAVLPLLGWTVCHRKHRLHYL